MADDPSLDDLRREIDRIDDSLHDLLMHRCDVVRRIGEAKGDAAVYLRPGREAEILRRLVARHQGPFPKAVLVRMWREMMSALVSLQGPFGVAVYMPERGAGFIDLARGHYGSHSALTSYRTAGQVVRAVADGEATVGVVPVPTLEGEPWWQGMMGQGADVPRIIGRLPFTGPRADSAEGLEALVIARLPQDATGNDRSWLAFETLPDISRARLKTTLLASGLEPREFSGGMHSEDRWTHLVEFEGYVAPDDRRILRMVEKADPVLHAVVLGGYPVPLSPEELAP
ncbi:chorismate mutase [Telmatospirillum sp. J64-1]|uniref:chorismate mutase n=1 Tax=Telmatospirillum sp. J64-1 TaxID=2502183 RepID=UPI00115EABD7|nr:chorismate mutase [Telmatospirillum sp. J64-1]